MGAGLLGRGLRLIARRPRLFLLGAIPPLITSVIFTGVLVALIMELDPAVDWLTPFADGWARGLATAIRVLVGAALVSGAVLLMVISFTTLTLALGSPLYDKLSESVEASFGEVPELNENVARGIFRALRQAFALIAISALGALVLFATGFIPVVGQTVVPVVSATFGGWMLEYRARRLGLRTTRDATAFRSSCGNAEAADSSPRFRSPDLPLARHPAGWGGDLSDSDRGRHAARSTTPR